MSVLTSRLYGGGTMRKVGNHKRRIRRITVKGDRSIMGLLIKAEATMQEEEVIAQVLSISFSLRVLDPDARNR
jgi:hypothetical protein